MDTAEKTLEIDITPTLFECNGTGTVVFNFTFWNERTETQLGLNKFDATFTAYTIGNTGINSTGTISVNNTAEVNICTNLAGNYGVIADIEYSRPEYDNRFYYYFNKTIPTVQEDVKLYLLEISYATRADFEVFDENDNPLSGAVYVKIQKYYTGSGTYKTVAMLKPDDNGEDSTFLRFYDTWYRFIVEQDGAVIYVSSATKIIEEDNTIRVPVGAVSGIFEQFENLAVSLTFSNVTRNYTAIFSKTDGTPIKGCLSVVKRKLSGDTFVCEKCEDSTSATLICGVGADNATYTGTFSAEYNSVKEIVKVLEINLGEPLARTFAEDGLFLAMMVFLLLVAVGTFNPQMSIGLGLLGLVLSSLAGFIYISISVLLGLIVLGGYLIFKVRTT